MVKALFIGGAVDGQWIDLPDPAGQYVEIPTLPPCTYLRRELLDGPLVRVVYVHTGTDSVILALIDGYRAKLTTGDCAAL